MRLFANEDWSGKVEEPSAPEPTRLATAEELEEHKRKLKEKSK